MQKVIAIVGPTSSGKTALAVRIAKAVGGEVVSGDSRQVYRGLDLGTGKVTPKEARGIPHHLIDIASPKKIFNALEYAQAARTALAEIGKRGKSPIVAGGTGFYIDAALGRAHLPDVPPDLALRKKLETRPLEKLQEELKKADPKRYRTIDLKNPRRLIRAIEIARWRGKRKMNAPEPERYEVLWIGIVLPFAELRARVHRRLAARLKGGMLREAKSLHRKGLSYARMESLGLEYRYMARHLQGKISYEEMVWCLESEILKYAKRQMTWFRKNKLIRWLPPESADEAVRRSKSFLKKKSSVS